MQPADIRSNSFMDFSEIAQLADQGVAFVGTSLGMTRSDWTEWQNRATSNKDTLKAWLEQGYSLVSVAKHGQQFMIDMDDRKSCLDRGFRLEWLDGYYAVDTPSGGEHDYGLHDSETEALGNLMVVRQVKGDIESPKILELKLNNQSVAAPTAHRVGQPKKVDGVYKPRTPFAGMKSGINPDFVAWLRQWGDEPKSNSSRGTLEEFHPSFDMEEFLEHYDCTERNSGKVNGALHVVVESCPHCGRDARKSTVAAGVSKFIFGGCGFGFICHACGLSSREELETWMAEQDPDFEPWTEYIYKDDDPELLLSSLGVEDADQVTGDSKCRQKHPIQSNTPHVGDLGENAVTTCHLSLLSPSRSAESQETMEVEGKITLTDVGNGKRLAHLCGYDIAYVVELKSWFVWNGQVWKEDVGGVEIVRIAKRVAQTIYIEASKAADEDEAKQIASWATSSHSKARLDAMIALAQSEGTIAHHLSDFDANPEFFNCANGVINLRTGELMPHDRKHFCMKLSPVAYNPEAIALTWLKFLTKIMRGNESMIAYLQRAAGYSMVGSSEEESLNFCWGGGRNGKGKFLGALSEVLGEYAATAQFKTFLADKKDSGGHSEDLACLHGARMVVAQESNVTGRFNEATIKTLTGRDKQRASFKHKNSFEFTPKFTLWLASNSKPKIIDMSEGMRSRIKLIPFTVTIPEAEIDRKLPDKLRKEYEGILAWCVRGAVEWFKRGGLDYPEEVINATNEYFKDEDVIQHFIEEKLELDPNYKAPAAAVYLEFKCFADLNSFYVFDSREFKKRMEQKGWESKHTNTGSIWFGFRLKTSVSEFDRTLREAGMTVEDLEDAIRY